MSEVNKNLTIEDVIAQMKEILPTVPNEPTKILVSPSHMRVIRQMMDAGTLGNVPPSKEIHEPEE